MKVIREILPKQFKKKSAETNANKQNREQNLMINQSTEAKHNLSGCKRMKSEIKFSGDGRQNGIHGEGMQLRPRIDQTFVMAEGQNK